MVWGMMLPSGFGEFWPLGQFEGVVRPDRSFDDLWNKRLKDYYIAQTSKGRRALIDIDEESNGSYAYYVSRKFISEWAVQPDPDLPPLTPIQPHEVPQFFQTQKGYKTLGAMITLNSGILTVNEALKNIIERLEPGVHHFYPIEIRMPRGQVYPMQYYGLVVGQYFDSFSPADSDEGSCKLDIVRFRYEKTKAGVSGLAFCRSVYGQAHLWRERRIIGLLTCFSDELVAEITNAGLRIPKHYKMKDV